MSTDWASMLKDVRKNAALLKRSNERMLGAFHVIRDAVHTEEVLDAKTRELIAIAVAVARQCDGCIASHITQAKGVGVSAEEVGAAIGVAMAISTGSAYVYGLKALEAYEQL